MEEVSYPLVSFTGILRARLRAFAEEDERVRYEYSLYFREVDEIFLLVMIRSTSVEEEMLLRSFTTQEEIFNVLGFSKTLNLFYQACGFTLPASAELQ